MNALRLLVQAVVLAALLAALAFVLTGIGASRLDEALAQNALLTQRAAELRGRFGGSSEAVAEATLPAALAHPGATAAAATLALQQQIVDLGATHRLTLLTFGAARPPYDLDTEVIAVELEAQGEWSDAIRFLAAVEALTPRVAVASLALRAMSPASQPGARAPVSLRVVVWGFHPVEGS